MEGCRKVANRMKVEGNFRSHVDAKSLILEEARVLCKSPLISKCDTGMEGEGKI